MDKLRGADWGGMLKTVTNKVKQYTLNLTDLEVKVEDATSNETWGPHGSVMTEIADAAFDFENYRQIMGVIARRLQEKDENWRMCYKALLLLEFLVKHGPMKVVQDVASSASVLDRLTNFQFKDPNGKDHGVNVRHRAKELLQLVNDPDRVRAERNKAKSNKAKYTGVSATEMRMGGFHGGGSSSYGQANSQRALATGSSSFGRSGGSGAMGGAGSSSFGARGGHSQGQEDAEEDYHYISKRTTVSEGVEADALTATRARIDALKLSSRSETEERPGTEGEQQRKRLTDVKVNPKIAASLGLKFPPPAPAAPAAAAAPQVDLFGGLSTPAPAASATDLFDAFPAPSASAPAAAAAPATDGWDAFGGAGALPLPAAAAAPSPASDLFAALSGAPAAAPAPAAPAAAGAWDAFGAASAAPAPAAAAAPVDLFGALSAPAAPAFDPFANMAADPFAAPPAPIAAAAPPPAPASPMQAPAAAGTSPAKPYARPLPEDMFSDLSGVPNKRAEPMGSARGLQMDPAPIGTVPSPTAGAAAAAGGMPSFGAQAPAAPAAAPHPGMQGGMPGLAMPGWAAAPQGGMPGMGMPGQQGRPGFGMPGQQGRPGFGMPGQQAMPGFGMPGQQAMPSMGFMGAPAPSSVASAPQQSGGKDPFADLLG